MDSLLCHSGMLLGSILSLAFVATSVSGLGLLAALVLRSTRRQTTNG